MPSAQIPSITWWWRSAPAGRLIHTPKGLHISGQVSLNLCPSKLGFPCGSAGKESACNMGDLGSAPGLGRSPGEGKESPLQYSGLENSMDWTVHEVAESVHLLLNILPFVITKSFTHCPLLFSFIDIVYKAHLWNIKAQFWHLPPGKHSCLPLGSCSMSLCVHSTYRDEKRDI